MINGKYSSSIVTKKYNSNPLFNTLLTTSLSNTLTKTLLKTVPLSLVAMRPVVDNCSLYLRAIGKCKHAEEFFICLLSVCG